MNEEKGINSARPSRSLCLSRRLAENQLQKKNKKPTTLVGFVITGRSHQTAREYKKAKEGGGEGKKKKKESIAHHQHDVRRWRTTSAAFAPHPLLMDEPALVWNSIANSADGTVRFARIETGLDLLRMPAAFFRRLRG